MHSSDTGQCEESEPTQQFATHCLLAVIGIELRVEDSQPVSGTGTRSVSSWSQLTVLVMR
jgi:hypothetical protein